MARFLRGVISDFLGEASASVRGTALEAHLSELALGETSAAAYLEHEFGGCEAFLSLFADFETTRVADGADYEVRGLTRAARGGSIGGSGDEGLESRVSLSESRVRLSPPVGGGGGARAAEAEAEAEAAAMGWRDVTTYRPARPASRRAPTGGRLDIFPFPAPLRAEGGEGEEHVTAEEAVSSWLATPEGRAALGADVSEAEVEATLSVLEGAPPEAGGQGSAAGSAQPLAPEEEGHEEEGAFFDSFDSALAAAEQCLPGGRPPREAATAAASQTQRGREARARRADGASLGGRADGASLLDGSLLRELSVSEDAPGEEGPPQPGKLTVPQLKTALRARGLPVSGAKAALLARLNEDMQRQRGGG